MPSGSAVLVGTAVAVVAALLFWAGLSWVAKRLFSISYRLALSRDSLTYLVLLPLTLEWVDLRGWEGPGLIALFMLLKVPVWTTSCGEGIASKKLWCILLVPAILYGYLYRPAYPRPLDLFEDGVRLAPANEILRGESPYSDNFLYHGLVEDASKSLLGFKAWGTSFSSYIKMEALLAPLGAVAAYFLCWAVVGSSSKGLAVVVLLILLGHVPPARFACAFGGLAFLVTATRSERPQLAFAAGAFLSLAVFQSLESGAGGWLVAVVFLGLWIIGGQARGIGKLCVAVLAGGVAGAIPFVAYIVSRGSFVAFLQTSFRLLLPLEDRLSRPFLPQVMDGLGRLVRGISPDRLMAKTLMLIAPLPMIVWASIRLLVVRLRGRWTNGELGLLAAWAGGFVLYRGVIQRPDFFHLNKLMVFGGLLWALAIAEIWKGWLVPRKSVLAAGLQTAALALVAAVALQLALTAPAEPILSRLQGEPKGMKSCVVNRLGGTQLPPEQANRVEEIVHYLQTELDRNEPFFEFCLAGLLYFLADRPNPIPYPHSTMAATWQEQLKVIDLLQRERPKVVLFPSGRDEQRYESMGSYFRQPLLAEYLYDKYKPVDLVAGFLILGRAEEVPAGRTRIAQRCIWPSVDMRFLPAIYGKDLGQWRQGSRVVAFESREIESTWKITSGRRTSHRRDGSLMLSGGNRGVELTSPPLALDPSKATWLSTMIGTTSDRLKITWEGQVPFRSKSSTVMCSMDGARVKRYIVELGCVPSWRWSGRVFRLRLHWPKPGCRVTLREVSFLSSGTRAVPRP
jgi:hypothetical protein